jgi:hypothetical protein
LKTAVKYGLFDLIGIIAWVVIAHLLVPNPCSPVHFIGPIVFFNFLKISGIYLGMAAPANGKRRPTAIQRWIEDGMSIACLRHLLVSVLFTPHPDPRTPVHVHPARRTHTVFLASSSVCLRGTVPGRRLSGIVLFHNQRICPGNAPEGCLTCGRNDLLMVSAQLCRCSFALRYTHERR